MREAGAGDGLRADGTLTRERLLGVLRRRHRRRLVLIEAPPGFGRSTLLAHAAAEGPRDPADADVMVDVAGRRLADEVARACEAHTGGQAAVLVDDAHLATDADRLAEVVRALPEHGHLVVTLRQGSIPGIARALASGATERLQAVDLAFTLEERRALGLPADWSAEAELAAWPAVAALQRAHGEDLVADFLREEVLDHLHVATADALGRLAAVGGGGPALRAALGDDHVLAGLAALPLVEVTATAVRCHPIWRDVTRVQTADDEVVACAVEDRVARGALEEGGDLAVEAGLDDVLADVVTRALTPYPPQVGRPTLARWAAAGVLAPDAPVTAWLDGVLAAQAGAQDRARDRLEAARAGFQAAGDVDAESRVVLHLGALARRTDDLGLLVEQVVHSQRLAASGSPVAAALAALGRAVEAALRGDPHEAARVLEEGTVASLQGEWAAQFHMVLGTNRAWVGRDEDAVVSLTRATGLGSVASRATAEHLLASVLWTAGRVDEALAAAERAEVLATRGSSVDEVALATATRALLCCLAGTPDAPDVVRRVELLEHGDAEAHALTRLARVVGTLQRGEEDDARRQLEALPDPTVRPTRSKLWHAALDLALLPGSAPRWDERRRSEGYLNRPLAAGRAGAEHLATGEPVAAEHRPFLPSRWWPPRAATVRLQLLGGATVCRAGLPVEDPAWNRGRVRELALHLALHDAVGREAVAASLWPDLDDRAARRNLRVTLTHLLDVIDPDRVRGEGSDLLVDRDGRLALDTSERLQVDLVEQAALAGQVVAAATIDPATSLAAAQRLVGLPGGRALGGEPVGEWADAPLGRHEALVGKALATAAGLGLDHGDGELTAAAADRLLAMDPWSEQARQLLIAAHLAAGDIDQARRVLSELWDVLAELGLDPQPRSIELARMAGVRRLG